MEYPEKVLRKSELLQKDCHEFVDDLIKKKPELSYQDAMNTWLFIQLAELHLAAENLDLRTYGKL